MKHKKRQKHKIVRTADYNNSVKATTAKKISTETTTPKSIALATTLMISTTTTTTSRVTVKDKTCLVYIITGTEIMLLTPRYMQIRSKTKDGSR